MKNLTSNDSTALSLPMINFLAENVEWLVAVSLVSALLTLALVPILITRLPADYFCHRHRQHPSRRHPLFSLAIKTAKNLLGFMFLLTGFLLLFLPGQGLILMLVGMLIMNYPGKYALERWLIKRRVVVPALNALRVQYSKPPLLPP